MPYLYIIICVYYKMCNSDLAVIAYYCTIADVYIGCAKMN